MQDGEFGATFVDKEWFWLSLLEEEIPVVRSYVTTQSYVDEVATWIEENIPDRWAGTELEVDEEGPFFLVRVTGEISSQLRENAPTTPRVEFESVRYSMDFLLTEQRELSSAVEARVPEEQLAGSFIDERTNRIVFLVSEGAVDEVERQVGDRDYVVIDVGVGAVEPQIWKDDPLPNFWVEAGQAIGQTNTPNCTSGFAVESYFGPFILTAAHCGSLNSPDLIWHQGGLNLGEWVNESNGGDYEAALISTYGYRANTGNIHITDADDREPVHIIASADAIDQIVCNTGMTSTGLSGNNGSATRCGPIHIRTHDLGAGYNAVFRVADYRSLGGDSGAGVYRETIFGRSAEGIHFGCVLETITTCRSVPEYWAIYSYMPLIAAGWGLSLTPPN